MFWGELEYVGHVHTPGDQGPAKNLKNPVPLLLMIAGR